MYVGDVLRLREESADLPGEELLETIIENGKYLGNPLGLETIREHASDLRRNIEGKELARFRGQEDDSDLQPLLDR